MQNPMAQISQNQIVWRMMSGDEGDAEFFFKVDHFIDIVFKEYF
jgi:hypothetical protein